MPTPAIRVPKQITLEEFRKENPSSILKDEEILAYLELLKNDKPKAYRNCPVDLFKYWDI